MKWYAVMMICIIAAMVTGALGTEYFKAQQEIAARQAVDATMTVMTDSPTLKLIDSHGVEVGSIELGDEVTVRIRRRR